MIADIHSSLKIFAIDMLTALKPSLEHGGKHVLRLLRLCLDGDQDLVSCICRLYIFCNLDTSVESMRRVICC